MNAYGDERTAFRRRSAQPERRVDGVADCSLVEGGSVTYPVETVFGAKRNRRIGASERPLGPFLDSQPVAISLLPSRGANRNRDAYLNVNLFECLALRRCDSVPD